MKAVEDAIKAQGPNVGGSGDGEDGDGDGKFSGSCEASFQCEGDAIQCAIALEQHKWNCTLTDLLTDEDGYSDTFSQEKTDGRQAHERVSNTSINVNDLNTSSIIGSGACVDDLDVQIMGQTLTIPFSILCPYLAAIGLFLKISSLILAAKIIVGKT